MEPAYNRGDRISSYVDFGGHDLFQDLSVGVRKNSGLSFDDNIKTTLPAAFQLTVGKIEYIGRMLNILAL